MNKSKIAIKPAIKKSIPTSIVPRDMQKVTDITGNVYAAVKIMAKRAKQLSAEQKEELTEKLAQFATPIDNLEEIFENREQIEISRYYERLPKTTSVAAEEFLEGKIQFKDNNKEQA